MISQLDTATLLLFRVVKIFLGISVSLFTITVTGVLLVLVLLGFASLQSQFLLPSAKPAAEKQFYSCEGQGNHHLTPNGENTVDSLLSTIQHDQGNLGFEINGDMLRITTQGVKSPWIMNLDPKELKIVSQSDGLIIAQATTISRKAAHSVFFFDKRTSRAMLSQSTLQPQEIIVKSPQRGEYIDHNPQIVANSTYYLRCE